LAKCESAHLIRDQRRRSPLIINQPVLEAFSFDGGAEAVIANYGQSQLLIVEFTTPQFSIENDQRIWTKIDELKKRGEPVPTAYRRVGNYSVFVFNAPDEKTANALIDQVKYEQVVQWLGDDPHLYQRLQRYFTQTSAGVFVAVLKSSGLSLLFCLACWRPDWNDDVPASPSTTGRGLFGRRRISSSQPGRSYRACCVTPPAHHQTT
jgi:hypothetical protein